MCDRMNAISVLKQKIARKEAELDALRILERVIPWDDLCDEEESKLWNYFCRSDT